MKIKELMVVLTCLMPSLGLAQQLTKQAFYFGGMGGLATLSGDANAVITANSASTSSYDPSNGGAASAFIGVHVFDYLSLQTDYVWNRNDVVLVSSVNGSAGSSFYRLPETVTQNAFLGNVLIYFRKRESRIRPYLSEGAGGGLIHSRLSGGGIIRGVPALPPASSDHASIGVRTSVGLDVRLGTSWYLRYSFGETITRNTFVDQLSPPKHRIAKNFQSLFGIYFRL
ncbi:MAG TPA: outer membrane beta-barrel protein [Candidatus Acidoferrum sp.]|nr:outer membrane beta-barrel protein [Candidatus Acidoferrum sp.]